MAAVSLFSNETISPKGLATLMQRLQATRNERGWELSRNGRTLLIELADIDPDLYSDKDLREIAEHLEGKPRSRVLLMFDDRAEDKFEMRMAVAVSKAMAELWPIAFDDNTGQVEAVRPPRVAGTDS